MSARRASDVSRTIIAAGGVLYRNGNAEPEVALIYRRGVWDLPKGKKEDDENIRQCAVREVAEEIGIDQPDIVASLGDSWHTYELDGEPVGKTTYWFVMKPAGSVEFSPQQEEDIEKVEWFTLSRALALVGYENLRKILDSFQLWHEALKKS